jgi:glycosyltransferase involved in cell wall biosynthesis
LAAESGRRGRRVLVVGSGTRFLSGISVYSFRLADALAEHGDKVSLLTMRRLLPARLYPGWKRVGADLTKLELRPDVAHYDGVDWFWIPSIFRAAWFIVRNRPEVAVFEWWTGTVLHSYIFLVLLVRALGGRVIVEFHEVQDTGEAAIPLVGRYVRAFAPVLWRLADGFAVHSEFDRELVGEHWPQTRRRPIAVMPHGPHDHYRPSTAADSTDGPPAPNDLREAPQGVINILFFGVIRPYKGLDHLVEAFDQIPDAEIERFWLTVVGETWEGFTEPVEMIKRSRRRSRITLVNRYVTDEELDGYMNGADAVALPYTRSSLSGPLHVAMGYGVPIVMSETGGNVEAAAGYGGIVLVKPSDPAGLAQALRGLTALVGQRFAHPHSWSNTAESFDELFDRVSRPGSDENAGSLTARTG